MEKNDIIVQEIPSIQDQYINLARIIFIEYFTDLYQHVPLKSLGLQVSLGHYLKTIFQKTEQAFKDKRLLLAFAYINDQVVGFIAYEFIDDNRIGLIRTLPVVLIHKQKELAIRIELMRHVEKQSSIVQKLLVMIRKANVAHIDLCLKSGFDLHNTIFEESDYIHGEYNQKFYNGYVRIVQSRKRPENKKLTNF